MPTASNSGFASRMVRGKAGGVGMIKIMWFLKRARHLTLEEFHRWWMEIHAPMIVAAQKPYLRKYVVNLRWPDDPLPGKPAEDAGWDGCAEQWFDSEADFNAVHGGATTSAIQADTLKHISRHARMMVRENPVRL
jgi:uncharacterized protein (TIGR02118 family)